MIAVSKVQKYEITYQDKMHSGVIYMPLTLLVLRCVYIMLQHLIIIFLPSFLHVLQQSHISLFLSTGNDLWEEPLPFRYCMLYTSTARLSDLTIY